MKKMSLVLILLLIAAGSFFAGYLINLPAVTPKLSEARKILYYVDPMNPAFKSDKPGIAPCGMALEPVYADRVSLTAGGADLRVTAPAGTINISAAKQQVIGVKVATVEKVPWSHTLRVLGRVVPDETRVYRINAALSCSIENVLPVTTGSLVQKDELLATYYSPDYRTTLQVYYNIIKPSGAASGVSSAAGTTPATIAATKELRSKKYDNYRLTGRTDTDSQKEYYRQILMNYGFGEIQLAEIERTLTIPDVVEVRAPITGFIINRNISPGLRVDRGAELFRIADLSKVWILADIFENEASFFKPGMTVKMELPYQKKVVRARLSNVLPQFDPSSRTLKVRLEAENPGYVMRPDMFANVELQISGQPAILVPLDAVLDSGLKKTVFIDRGNGFFEPRPVETGRLLGDRVEIVKGLMPGEKIVVSGNFLIDSETRLRQAGAGISGKVGRDPVCGMNIDVDRSQAEGNVREYKGKSYFFCSPECRKEFDKDPEKYLKSVQAQEAPKTGAHEVRAQHSSHDHRVAAKPQSAKMMPGAHDTMVMPAVQTPAVMPGMPPASPQTESKAQTMANPPSGAPIGHPQPQFAPGQNIGSTPLSGAPAVAPVPAGKSTEILTPATGVSGPLPMPGSKSGNMFTPSADTAVMKQGTSAFPIQGSVPELPQGAAPPLPGVKADGTPPAASGAPGMNRRSLRLQSLRGRTLPGQPEAAPMPAMRPEAAPATDAPEGKQ
jgi:membrane fusion protein, copper/silver efflux system